MNEVNESQTLKVYNNEITDSESILMKSQPFVSPENSFFLLLLLIKVNPLSLSLSLLQYHVTQSHESRSARHSTLGFTCSQRIWLGIRNSDTKWDQTLKEEFVHLNCLLRVIKDVCLASRSRVCDFSWVAESEEMSPRELQCWISELIRNELSGILLDEWSTKVRASKALIKSTLLR